MTDEEKTLLDKHSDRIQSLGFDILLSIAKSEEPLTYSFTTENGEHQIEVFFSSFSDDELQMVVSLDSNWNARFKKQDKVKTINIRR